jgi:hypothetical protein
MIGVETEIKIQPDIGSIENNRFQIIELYQNHKNVFRVGTDKENRNFLVTRFVNELPNILITEEGSIALMGINETNSCAPLNPDRLSQDLFNKIPNIPPVNINNIPNIHILFYSENKKRFLGFKTVGKKFQLQTEDKKKFLDDIIFLAEQKYQNPYKNFSPDVNFILLPRSVNQK